MKRNRLLALVLGGLCALLAACQRSDERYVVVLSMDGFRSDYPERAHTPTLDSLGQAGVKAAFRPSYPSVTFPNHYSMATGLHPDHHGIISNSFYDAALDSVYTMRCDDPRFFGGEPIWNTAERQGVRTAAFYWVGSEIALPSGQPSTWKKFDSSVPFPARADSVIAWLQRPEVERPHLIMWYFEEPDHTGHLCTPDSSATLRMVEHVDSVLGYFFNRARTLDIFDKIDFLVVSDHGMATYTPEESVNLIDYLPRDSFRYVFEGVPTLLYPKAGYADKAYEILKKVPNVTVWRKDEIPEKFVYGVDEAVLPVFMEKIAGLKAGDKFDFTIPAEQAFGLRNENHIMKLDRNLFLNPEGELDNRVKSGATLPMHTTDGALVYGLVLMVEKDGVTIDFNHPLAGENLHYKGEVKLVRDATEEELNPPHSCGCCSGCGGHDHGCDDGCCGGCGSHEC